MSTGHGPTFVVAGAARAGSTAVIESLRAHPDVFVTLPKEPHFFGLGNSPVAFTGPGDDLTINRVAVTDRTAYLNLYPEPQRYRALGDGSVSTLYYYDRAIPAILDLNPELRIVIVLREPVARAYSSHQYLLNRGYEPELDFLRAVEDEERRRAQGWHHLWHYTGMSTYAVAVREFLKTFGPEQVGVWFHDELTDEPEHCLSEVHRFVGADPQRSARLTAPRVNASGQPRRRAVHAAMSWAGQHDWVRGSVKRVVPFRVREAIRSKNLRPSSVPQELARELAPQFVDDISDLEDALGRAVPASWRQP